MSFRVEAKKYTEPESMADAYLSKYYVNGEIEYPINPFDMLKNEGVLFSISDFYKLEGLYIPASGDNDIPVVGINGNRPITRQRFTAAHELCHHFRDADRQINCPINGKKNDIEKFADGFAAALLMPIDELCYQVDLRRDSNGNVEFDDVLTIADYFGVSFEACLYRIAYRIHAISGDTSPDELKMRISSNAPDKKRKEKHITYAKLYAELFDSYAEQLTFTPTDHARYVFQNEYIYNDSRMEGLDVTLEQASEIVTDLRRNAQDSKYCKEINEAYMSIAGHYDMYKDIFAVPVKESISVYDIFTLNKKLFSYYPCPEFGGTPRQNNVLVLGAKFETVDYHNIYAELAKIDAEVREAFASRKEKSLSMYIKHVAEVHHKITVIHPFREGNGRTSRAFMNTQLVRSGLPPLYIKVEERKQYIDALAEADKTGNYDELYEVVFRVLLRSYMDLNKK